jgi:hypothetical protein
MMGDLKRGYYELVIRGRHIQSEVGESSEIGAIRAIVFGRIARRESIGWQMDEDSSITYLVDKPFSIVGGWWDGLCVGDL